MSSRHRQSGVRATPNRPSAASSQNRTAHIEDLPPYKKPSHPLNERAQASLRALNDHSVAQLKTQNDKAGDRVTEAAALVLDTLYERQAAVAKLRPRWEKGIDTESQEQDESRLAELQSQVEEYSKKLEESMRAIVDNSVATQRMQDSLAWLQTHAPGRLQQEHTAQISQQQSQRGSQWPSRSQRRRTQDRDDDDIVDVQQTQESMGPTPGPTPLSGSQPSLTGLSEMYTDRVEREKMDYSAISYTARYSRNEAYSNFKKMEHDARFRDDRPLPDPETWFNEAGSPALGVTGRGRDHEVDDEDDIVMERATISIKCPLTFLPYKDPYTSSKCPHTFERTAIMEMIRKSVVRVGGGSANSGEKAVMCPVSGCDQMLRSRDLHHDPVLVRRIKRLQQQEAREAEQSDAEEEEEGDDEDEERDVSISQPRIKVSPSSRRQATPIGDGSQSDEEI